MRCVVLAMGLRHVFGDKPIHKLFDFLLVHREWDYPISTMSEATGVSYRTLQKIVPFLVKRGLMRETRAVRGAKMYTLNFSSPSVKKLDEFALASDLEVAAKSRMKRALPV